MRRVDETTNRRNKILFSYKREGERVEKITSSKYNFWKLTRNSTALKFLPFQISMHHILDILIGMNHPIILTSHDHFLQIIINITIKQFRVRGRLRQRMEIEIKHIKYSQGLLLLWEY
ncbi:hypothetical protein Anas_13813 [Armadillidium nasatum]|uniref:Uncharacterized protein n=1 Tax=Armadillidium nasatum TaxID=96803 RepID=A0A5N5T3A3_9CRUS|nr:hypothetical protein Anas_13813 [Armadillidium nasatum]